MKMTPVQVLTITKEYETRNRGERVGEGGVEKDTVKICTSCEIVTDKSKL